MTTPLDPTGYDDREKFCPPLPQHDLDHRETLRRANLEVAQRAVLGTPCGDWPASDPITHPDLED